VLFIFFSQRFSEGIESYGLYLLLGMVQYTYFANATTLAMRTLLSMRQLTRETVFPKELLVVSSAISSTIDFIIAMAGCVLIAYATGVAPSWRQLWLPVVVGLQFLLVVWVSLLLACVYPFARDLDHIYQVLLRALLFLTPIFYAKSLLAEGAARYLITFNPLAHLIDQSRLVLISGEPPAATILLVLVLSNVLLAWLSWRLFKALEPRLAELV
jgi:ABC-type polysaccharide/polyol phosphate export permease